MTKHDELDREIERDARRWQAIRSLLKVHRSDPGDWTCWLELACVPLRSKTADPDELIDQIVRTVEQARPPYRSVAIEDQDLKTAADCKEKFDNIQNFGGTPPEFMTPDTARKIEEAADRPPNRSARKKVLRCVKCSTELPNAAYQARTDCPKCGHTHENNFPWDPAEQRQPSPKPPYRFTPLPGDDDDQSGGI